MHRREGKLIISATDLVGFLACGHLTHLERAQAAGLVNKPDRGDDPAVELLRWRGGKHEERYIELLEAEGRQITDLAGNKQLSYAEQAERTVDAMRHGDEVIYQGTVFDGRWLGYPDFLLRVPGSSALGDWHYEVSDTKLAHSAKASALVQICSYVEQVERIQKVEPEKVQVVTGGAQVERHEFRTAEMMAYYRYARQRFEEALDEAQVGPADYPIARATSYPDPVEHCAVCRWSYAECRVVWHRDDALPLVAAINRRQRQLLTTNSVGTMRALSELPPPIQLEGLKPGQADSLWRMREQARLQVASAGLDVPVYELLEPERDAEGALVSDRGLSALPEPSAGDLFFDIEGDPFAYWEGLDYLFGIWSGDGQWQSLWAMNRDEEKRAFEQVMDLFMARWERDPQMHIYHYAPYEPTALKRLAGRHGTREEELDRLLRGRVFVDLYRVVRQGLRVGTERYSIKNLEPLYGFTREVELRDANSSIVEFEKILEIGDPGGELKANIEAYNKDDCVSTQLLRDWLERRRPEAEHKFGIVLPRAPAGEDEIDEELSARQEAVRALERRLTDGLPSDVADRNPDQQATWLLAQLLDWHRRENKAAWWRFFDLLTRSDEELFHEREPIAHLEPLGIDPQGGTRQSHDHRYSFPAQEHSIDVGNGVHDPKLVGRESRTGTGTVQAIDKNAGIVVIRRPRSWAGQHPSSIVPLDVYGAQAQQEALMRIGEWVADNGIDSPLPRYRAARDLLRRLPPRRHGGATGNLARDTEIGSEAARRLSPELEATTLPILGPPGSGKTYTGARMILDLVRAGRQVGITSNSHKVIANLLDAVCDAAEEIGYPLRAMQKGEKEEVHKHAFVERAPDNKDVVAALAGGEVDVAAGTPWLWARHELEDLIDTLFIDEAGQVSLANVVAMAGAARNVVLLGDPQQLDQPTQGVHPDGAGRSALAHLLDTAETVPPERGLFLEKTWRMHPRITGYTSELFYEGKLESIDELERQRVLGDDWLAGSGLRWVAVAHDGNTNASEAEAERVSEIWQALVGRRWVDSKRREQVIGRDDIVIVSPYNAHRLVIQERLPEARVGTVDKFQGQEAAVSIYTMASSRSEDAPRGLGFLYSLNRLNVATSRARALAIVVASPALLNAVPRTPDQLRMVNGLCAFVEAAAAQSA